MFPTNHSTSDNKTMTITAISGNPAKPTTKTLPTATNRKPKYLVAVFSVLVVCIVAVLVVTVASQARNNTRQQQIDEDNNNNVVPSATEFRHPRYYINRPVTNSTTKTAESIILKNVKALIVRVVEAESLGNSSDGTSYAFNEKIITADK